MDKRKVSREVASVDDFEPELGALLEKYTWDIKTGMTVAEVRGVLCAELLRLKRAAQRKDVADVNAVAPELAETGRRFAQRAERSVDPQTCAPLYMDIGPSAVESIGGMPDFFTLLDIRASGNGCIFTEEALPATSFKLAQEFRTYGTLELYVKNESTVERVFTCEVKGRVLER